MNQDLTIIGSFLGGLFSFFAPCIIPVFLLYLAHLRNKSQNKFILLLESILFSLGFGVGFIILILSINHLPLDIIESIAGTLLLVTTLAQLEILQLNFHSLTTKATNSFFLGLALTISFSPCLTPYLTIFSQLPKYTSDAYLYIAFYLLGLCIPFILSAFILTKIKKIATFTSPILYYIQNGLSFLLIFVSILLITHQLDNVLIFVAK